LKWSQAKTNQSLEPSPSSDGSLSISIRMGLR
jgi:hypothetical protein